MSEKSIKTNIVKGTLVIILVSLLAKLASFISTTVIAAILGTSNESDALNTILGVEQVFYPMIGVGVWKVFLPLYKEKLVRLEEQSADELANKTMTFFTILTLIAVILLYLFTRGVVTLIAPGFDEATKLLCVRLIRISAPMYLFIISAAVYSSMLQCHNQFFGSQVREIASHIPVILLALICYRKYGVDALAVGILLGGVLRLLVELPFVKWGYHFRVDFDFKSTEMKQIIKSFPSAMLTEGVNQINVLVDKIMASMLGVGAVSALNYGNKLTNVLSGLLSTALSTALYPQFVELITLKKNKELQEIIIKVINIFSFIMVPLTIGCMLFSREIVSVVYQRGAFNNQSVLITSGVFACYCVGLMFVGINTIITNVFYADGQIRTMLIISIENLIINIFLNIILVFVMGLNGLALATSFSALITFYIRREKMKQVVYIPFRSLAPTFLKSAVIASAILVPEKLLLERLFGNVYVLVLVAVFVAVILYYLITTLLKMEETSYLMSLLKKKKRE